MGITAKFIPTRQTIERIHGFLEYLQDMEAISDNSTVELLVSRITILGI